MEESMAKSKCEWIPFVIAKNILQGELPDADQEILVTDGREVWIDTFVREGDECYLDCGNEIPDDAIAWMHLPAPYIPEAKREDER